MTAAELLDRLRAGERWRPCSWANSRLLEGGYCFVKDRHTFVEHTPKTVGASTSPAIAGIRSAMKRYGPEWEQCHNLSCAHADLHLAAMTRDEQAWKAAAGMATAGTNEEPIEVHWMRRALHAECELLDLAQREERDGKEICLLVLAIFVGGLVFREVAMAIATAIGGLLS